MQPGLNKCFLGSIFCNVHIATHAVDDVQHTLGVDADQFTKSVSLAILCSGNKLCFIDCWNRRHREISVSVSCLYHLINVHRLVFIRNKSHDLKNKGRPAAGRSPFCFTLSYPSYCCEYLTAIFQLPPSADSALYLQMR